MDKIIKKLMKLGYSIKFTEGMEDQCIFVTLIPLFGHETKLEDDKDFMGYTIEEALINALEYVD